MSKQLKSLLIVIPISLLLTGLAVLSFMLDPMFEATVYYVISMVICTVWAFFLAPTLLFAIVWAKNYFESLNFGQSFRFGAYLGCGWGILVVLLFLTAAPVIGTTWYIQTFKSLSLSIKNRRNSAPQTSDVFDL